MVVFVVDRERLRWVASQMADCAWEGLARCGTLSMDFRARAVSESSVKSC
jgi:hypothetical protein